jgi:hypothetical protein
LLIDNLRRRRGGGSRVRRSWYVDETYIKVNGRWCYLYRAIDRTGALVDVMLSETRGMAAAEKFFRSAKAVTSVTPARVTTDGHDSYPRAIRSQLGADVRHRNSQYLTDIFDKAFFAGPCYFYLARANRVAKSGCWDVSLPRAYDERVPLAAPVRLGGVVCQLATKRV